MADNFAFVKKYDADLYAKIHDAEIELKIDFISAGDKLRNTLEFFVGNIIKKYSLQNAIKKHCESNRNNFQDEAGATNPNSLYAQLCFLTNFDAIRAHGDRRVKKLVCERKRNGKFEPYFVSSSYKDFDGNIVLRRTDGLDKKTDAITFVRWAGNACHHDDKLEKPKVEPTYENILEAFRVFYHLLACYYADSQKNIDYNECNISLGKYEIIKSFVPYDSERTGCNMEYEAKRITSKGKTKWLIIREYKKSQIDKNFFLRGYDTTNFIEYQEAEIDLQIESITEFDDAKSPYYIFGYSFTRKPYRLAEKLEEISFENRYNMCIKIAKYFEELHTLEYPIYHRMLNHNCIYVLDCHDIKKDWLAKVIKFDFSKITESDALTVLEDAAQAVRKIKSENERKYLAPEWCEPNPDANWEKVDVFSLGILFCDILCGKIFADYNTLVNDAPEMLEQLGVSEEVIEKLGCMIESGIGSEPSDRPAVSDILEVLKKYRKG